MRLRQLISLGVLFTLFNGVPGWAFPANRATPERIFQLISQLGSNNFKEREGAAAALDAIGEPALAALKNAKQDRDPEVRRRAESLVNAIHKRVEIARILQPKQVHLNLKDVPLTEAVAEFARMTGFNIELADSPTESINWFLGKRVDSVGDLTEATLRALNPRITLDTGETSFWEAVDQFCQQFGLIESTGAVADLGRNVWNGQPVPGQRLAHISNLAFNGFDGRLVLEGGDPSPLPTCYAGSVRIRVKPANARMLSGQNRKTEAYLLVEVAPQPDLKWQGIVDFRLDAAVDDRGHSLSSSLSGVNQELLGGVNNNGLMFNGAVIWDVSSGQPRMFDGRSIPVRLKLANTRAKRLKEFRGVVSARVLAPPQPLITLGNVVKSAGQSEKGPNGESLKIIAASKLPSGKIKIRYRLEDPTSGWMLNNRAMMPGNFVLRRNNVVWQGPVTTETEQARGGSLALYDAKGESYRLEERKLEISPLERGISEWTVTYAPPTSRSQAEKFVYSGRRMVIIDIPFTLKDVPLN
jgi:hypothetical protein